MVFLVDTMTSRPQRNRASRVVVAIGIQALAMALALAFGCDFGCVFGCDFGFGFGFGICIAVNVWAMEWPWHMDLPVGPFV